MSATKRILLVDDDEFILICVKRMLEPRFEFDTAVGAQQALDAVTTRGPFAVIVTDMRMPGMSGIELLSRTREISPQTVGLLLSGDGHTDQTDASIKNGVVFRLVEKPCDSAELTQAIEAALAKHERMIQVTV